jgi:perosamine synthetase
MKHIIAEQAADYKTREPHPKPSTRRVPLIGGTTTLDDCLVALGYLTHPRQLVNGDAIAEFERAFAQKIGVRYAYSFCHGRVGLYGLLCGLGIRPGDEILLQVPTHIVVANAIRYTGARPVYVDCQLENYNIDLEQAEQRITPRTKALVLQHTFGIPVDLDAALDLTHRYGITLIEDCVHALGATYDGRQVGSFGHAAFFSSEETKTISTTMGGMVVTDGPELAARLQEFQQGCPRPPAWQTFRYILKLVLYHGMTEPHVHQYMRAIYEFFGKRNPLPQPTTDEEIYGKHPAAYEQRFSNAQAALGLRQLQRLESNVAHRRAMGAAYRKWLSARGFRVPALPAKADPAYVRYPVWVEDTALTVRIAQRRATLGTWFSSVLEEAASPACGDYEMGSCPRAEEAARHLVNLPTNPRVSEQDVEAIVSALIRAETMAKR